MIYVYAFLVTFWALAATLHMIDMRAEIQRLTVRKGAQTACKPLTESKNQARNDT